MYSGLSPTEAGVKRFLDEIGCKAAPVTSHKTADLRAIDPSGRTYLLEVESQAEDIAYWKELESAGKVTRKEDVYRTNVASAVIRHAAQQLRETQSGDKAFRIIAIVTSEDDRGTQAAEFRSTFYGIVPLVFVEEGGAAKSVDCFFFDYNEFFALRDIEAAIIFEAARCQLCVNTFADHSIEFRVSALCRYFQDRGGLLDPTALERAGEAYLADLAGNRKSDEAIIELVMKKYSLSTKPIPIRPVQFTGAVRVPDSE